MKISKAVHLLLLTAVFALCYITHYGPSFQSYNKTFFNIISVVFYIAAYAILVRVYDAYNIGYRGKTDIFVSHVLIIAIMTVGMYLLVSLAWYRYIAFSNVLYALAAAVLQVLITLAFVFFADKTYFKLNKPKKTVVIYRNQRDLNRLKFIERFDKHYKVIKTIENPDNDIDALDKQLSGAEAVFVVGIDAELRNGIAKYCVDKKLDAYFVPHLGDIIMAGAVHQTQFSCPVVAVRSKAGTGEYQFIKRAFDILMSLIGIILLWWLMLIVAIIIKLYDGGPAIYKQVRLTKDGKEFNILKFRSMRVDAEQDGVARLAKENDDRITPIGKFIRKCRLDELPQLFNILSGDMTIVGPRPERPEIAKQYEELIPMFSLRLQVKAGLTGYAQVYGKYNIDPYEKLEMDLMYINQMNPLLDLKLMFATVRVLFEKESTEGLKERSITALR